jgi:hypothetical protein
MQQSFFHLQQQQQQLGRFIRRAEMLAGRVGSTPKEQKQEEDEETYERNPYELFLILNTRLRAINQVTILLPVQYNFN